MVENLWWLPALLVPVLMCGLMMGGMALAAFLGLRRRPARRPYRDAGDGRRPEGTRERTLDDEEVLRS